MVRPYETCLSQPTIGEKSSSTQIHIDIIIPIFERTGDLCVRPWFGAVTNLTVDMVLSSSSINCCIRGIIPEWVQGVPVALMSSVQSNALTNGSSLPPYFSIVGVESAPAVIQKQVHRDEEEEEEINLCQVSRQIKILHSCKPQKASLVSQKISCSLNTALTSSNRHVW